MRRTTHRGGFTLVELAVCLTLLAILVPMVYAYALGIDDRFDVGTWHLQTADQVHTVSEALHADGRVARLMDDAVQFRHHDCVIDYRVADDALQRVDSCGGTQTLARGVTGISRQPAGVEVVFTRHLRQGRSQRSAIFIATEL